MLFGMITQPFLKVMKGGVEVKPTHPIYIQPQRYIIFDR